MHLLKNLKYVRRDVFQHHVDNMCKITSTRKPVCFHIFCLYSITNNENVRFPLIFVSQERIIDSERSEPRTFTKYAWQVINHEAFSLSSYYLSPLDFPLSALSYQTDLFDTKSMHFAQTDT